LLHNVAAFALFLLGSMIFCLRFLSLPQALLASPLCSGVVASLSGMFFIWVDVPIAVIWSFMSILLVLAVFSRKKSRCTIWSNALKPWTNFEILCVAMCVLYLVILGSRVPAPLFWDARSIWLFHASWFASSTADIQAAFSLESLAWSHPDYPPLGPGSIAVLWQLSGRSEHLRMGVVLLSMYPVFILSLAILRLRNAIAMAVKLDGQAFPLVLLLPIGVTLADGMIDKGYMDVIQSVSLVLIVSLFINRLTTAPSCDSAFLIIVSGFFAALSKQEGVWFLLIILLAITVVDFSQVKITMTLGFAVFPLIFFWKHSVEHFGFAQGSDASGLFSKLNELWSLESVAYENLTKIFDQYWATMFLPMLIFLVAGCSLIYLKRDLKARLQISIFLALSWSGSVLLILLTYSLGNTRNNLDWWLGTSFTRIIATSWGIVSLVLCLGLTAGVSTLGINHRDVHDDSKAL
jgi:hypothetical protein